MIIVMLVIGIMGPRTRNIRAMQFCRSDLSLPA
jgi:hypothetical protein